MSILNGFKTFERYLKTPNGYQLYSERQLAKDVLMGDGNDENNNIENTVGQLSNPNLLINGDFQVWQKGTEFHSPVSDAFRYYAPDRWCVYTNVASRTIKKVDDGVYTEASLIQLLERRLEVGKPYVLSACVNGGEIRTLSFIGGTDISNDYFAYWRGQNYDRISVSCKVSQIVNWVKLEQGTVATPFVPRLYAEEWMLCRRYYKKLPIYDSKLININLDYIFFIKCFSVKLRTVPSVTFVEPILALNDVSQDGFNFMVGYINNERVSFSAIKSSHGLTNSSILSSYGHIILDAEIYG